ncbi:MULTISPECIES: YchJ family protein [unclassified Streptomyces]|uniref:YchJ family protein n=1 Tax=unclassified Streptomyces TaxID=2593676 RepID=UPI002E2C01AA|nr:YchJ family protein [Streptomyces sp. NBC_01429]
MARRTSRTVRTTRRAVGAVTADSPCPCGQSAPHGRSAPYGECCGRFHTGSAAAPTPETLMRSRYSAFAVLDAPYLLRTWAPATRPARLELDPGTRWTGLEIVETTEGSAFHTTGTVTFRARFREDGRDGELLERSRFERHEGAWVYVDGTFPE